jgi:hypothetical protein
MSIKKFVCEKEWVRGDGPDYIRVTIYEVELGGKSVADITHHDSEDLANEWLADEWAIKTAPEIGEQLEFESDHVLL